MGETESKIVNGKFIKRIDSPWREGSGKGGLPKAAKLKKKYPYYAFRIEKEDGTVDYGFDTDRNAINLLREAKEYALYLHLKTYYLNGESHERD